MSRTKPSLRTTAIRKQLLIAEAEILRTQLGKDLGVIQQSVKGLGTQAKSIASLASLAATVVTGIAAFRRARKPSSNGEHSLLPTFLAGARAASAVWEALRSRHR